MSGWSETNWHKAKPGDIITMDMPVWKRRHFWEFWKPRWTHTGSKHYEYVVGDSGVLELVNTSRFTNPRP
jgi:hypothetical protein